jgi:RNA polymerase sigma-70 factor (ECF subfamily)
MSPEEYFATLWPALVPKLRAMLARAGAPVADRDDLVQETALRLYRMWPTVDHERGVEPLARRIAMNAWRDQWRRRGEREVLGDVPESATAHDTERAALARLEVHEVSRAMARLRPATAAVLRTAAMDAECGAAADGGTPAAVRMARSRARRALMASLRVACGVAAFAVAAVRALGRPARTGVATGAIATVALVLTLSISSAPNGQPGHLDVWPATAARPAAAVGHPGSVAAPRSGTRAGNGAGPRHRIARRSTAPTPYYVVHAGPGEVRAFVNVDIEGYGVRVQQSPANDVTPVCTYGSTPGAPVASPRCH